MSDDWLKLLQEERIEREKLNERISALEQSKELVLSYRELSKRECDGRIQKVKKELKELEKRMEEQETHTKYGTIEQVLENIDKMKKTWDENIESFLKQVDNKLDTRDKQISELEKKTSEGGSLYNLALEADANTNRLDKEIEKLKNK